MHTLSRAARRYGPWFLFFLLVALALQFKNHAFSGEFGGASDEPAHFVSGVMVAEYLRHAFGRPPVEFAAEFYLHYPKVAIGHWPPGFYAVQGAWYLVFPPSRGSAMALLAIWAGLFAVLVAVFVEQAFGQAAAGAAALFALLLPATQKLSSTLLMEIPLAALCTAALISYARFLREPTPGHAGCFSLVASVACLFKGSGLVLALVPPLAILFTGAFHLLRRFSFWLPALVVAAAAAPWYLLAPGALTPYTQPAVPTSSQWALLTVLLLNFFRAFGAGVFLLCLFGLIVGRKHWVGRSVQNSLWPVAASMLVGLFLFQLLIPPARAERHCLLAAGPVLLFATLGVKELWQAKLFQLAGHRARTVALVAFLTLTALAYLRLRPDTGPRGFGQLAQWLHETGARRGRWPVVLAASDEIGEGVLVAQLLLHRGSPDWVVARASQLLARSGWMGERYELRFTDPEQIQAYLRELPIQWVILHESRASYYPHQILLRAAIQADPRTWCLENRFPCRRANGSPCGELLLYKRSATAPAPHRPIVIDLTGKIGRELRWSPAQ